MISPSPAPLLTTVGVARWLNMSVGALAQMRHRGEGPSFIKIGRAVRYDREAVQAWLDSHRHAET